MSRHVRLLLDTHVLLWALGEPAKLDPAARAAIEDGANEVYVSAASAWEIEVKKALGKLEAPDDLDDQLSTARLVELPVRITHATALRRLPMIHRDPFDRMLVAQARVERLTMVTRDPKIADYGLAVLPA